MSKNIYRLKKIFNSKIIEKINLFFLLEEVDDILVDYVLKCISGPYLGKFLYINLTADG